MDTIILWIWQDIGLIFFFIIPSLSQVPPPRFTSGVRKGVGRHAPNVKVGEAECVSPIIRLWAN